MKSNIDPWSDGLLHRPNSELPGDAVSEGQAYGMIAALYSGDQTNFNRIWDAAEKNMWNATAGYYDWRWNKGAVVGTGGMATDADQDIALMLLFADSLVKKGMWTTHTSPKNSTYKSRALTMISTIWTSAVSSKNNLSPGAGWGGDAFVNPGYFSPATYRIFAKYDKTHNWNAVVEQCYAVLGKSPGAAKGMAPDWMVPDGSYYAGDLGYNPYRSGHYEYKDGIRVQWRLALDWLWFGEARAKKFLDAASTFIATPDRANFYDMTGSVTPATDTFSLGDGKLRSRQEYSELTVGMWACAAFASQGPDKTQAWADSLLAFLPDDATSWGRPSDANLPDRNGSTPNEQYFEQFLAWFGTAVLSGRFSNILDDLDDPNPTLPLAWSTIAKATPTDLDLQDGPLVLSGLLNKSAPWTVNIETYPAGQSWSTSGRSAAIQTSWNGSDADGKLFPQGWCHVTVGARGVASVEQWVWLGHHRDLRSGTDWLIIDDFSNTTLSPNFGSWTTFNNSKSGGTASVGPLNLQGTGADRALTYSYDLGSNGYQYCGLEWNSQSWEGLGASTKVRYRAKADHNTVMDLYLLQSDITDDNYFHILDTVTSTWKTFEHPYKSFVGRLASRSGNADPTKGAGFHWHIQADKCLKSSECVTGTITLDDIQLAGNLSQMISAPAAKIPMPDTLPYALIGVKKRSQTTSPDLRLRRVSHGLIELSAPSGASVRWLTLSGQDLGRSEADASGVLRWVVPNQARGVVYARPSNGRPSLPVVLH